MRRHRPRNGCAGRRPWLLPWAMSGPSQRGRCRILHYTVFSNIRWRSLEEDHACGVADKIGDRRRCMTWRKDHLDIEFADPESLAILEQPVPLRSIGWKGRPIVDAFPERLNTPSLPTSHQSRAQNR